MNRVKRVCFTDTNLEASCKIIGDCLSNSEIDRLLEQCGIANITPTGTKWKRLFACFADYQNKNKESNQILRFIQKALSPELYVERKNEFEEGTGHNSVLDIADIQSNSIFSIPILL